MSLHFFGKVIAKLKAAGYDSAEAPFIGCTETEVEKLENHYHIKFPASYKEFLSTMGKDCGNFLLGYDYSYDVLFSLKEGSQEIIAEDPSCSFKLSPNDFVFISSQGSQFLFFDTKSGDDPPVQYFLEGEKPRQKYDSFSQCLEYLADTQIAAAKDRIQKL